MINLFKRLIAFFKNASSSRTLSLLALLVIAVAIPLTVYIAQKRQEIRQHASAPCTPQNPDKTGCPPDNAIRINISSSNFASDIFANPPNGAFPPANTPLQSGQSVGMGISVGCGCWHTPSIDSPPGISCSNFRQVSQACSDNNLGYGDLDYYRQDCTVVGPAGSYTVNGHGSGSSGSCSVTLSYAIATPPTAPTPTPTPASGSAQLSLSLTLSGIGANGGNQNPVHPTRNVTVCLYASSADPTGDTNCDKAVVKPKGTVSFDPPSKNFVNASFDLGTGVNTGDYQILIKPDRFLRKRVPGVQTITAGTTKQIPLVTLLPGDTNNDNKIDLNDYNILVGCFGNKANTSSCTNKDGADIDDNGKIDGVDVNLFVISLSVQKGD